jgi:ribosomal protein S13
MKFILKKRNFALQSLKTIYGVSAITAKKLLGVVLLHPKASFKILEKKRSLIEPYVMKLKIAFKLRSEVFLDMLGEMKNRTNRGIRMLLRLPVRGQRTKTNGNTPKKQHKKRTFFPFGIKRVVRQKTVKNAKRNLKTKTKNNAKSNTKNNRKKK